jgi:transposase
MVALVRAGRTPEELSREFEPPARLISNRIAQADREDGKRKEIADYRFELIRRASAVSAN